MKKTATLIKANGEEQEVSPANGKDFSLEELQKFVGGSIEMGSTHDGRTLVFNEEGKLLGLPLNEKATKFYEYGSTNPADWLQGKADFIAGDTLIADYSMVS